MILDYTINLSRSRSAGLYAHIRVHSFGDMATFDVAAVKPSAVMNAVYSGLVEFITGQGGRYPRPFSSTSDIRKAYHDANTIAMAAYKAVA